MIILIFLTSIALLFFLALGTYIVKEVRKDLQRQKSEKISSEEANEEPLEEMNKKEMQACIKKMHFNVLVDEYLEKKFEGKEIEKWEFLVPDKQGRPAYKPFEAYINDIKIIFKNGEIQYRAVRTADLYKSSSSDSVENGENDKKPVLLTPEDAMVEVLVKRTLARIITSSEKAKASGFCQISLFLDDDEFKKDKKLAAKVARKISSTSSEYTVNVDEAEENHLIVSWIDTSAMDDFDLQNIA